MDYAREYEKRADIGQVAKLDEPTSATPAIRLANALKALEEAATYAENTAVRLCGSWPAEAGLNPAKDHVPDGLFPQIDMASERIERMAHQIIENMNRIQRVAG